ncbi:MAG: penicillin-binding transpeptidase domain-containing protein, partial [Pyrinomonadaceae bacterium]
ALGGRAGSVIVMDPRTGRVYAIVNQDWALRRAWSPASTIKPAGARHGEKRCLVKPTSIPPTPVGDS